MFLHRDQYQRQPERRCDFGRELLLMFTLSGFGGAVSLSIAEAMIDTNSVDGDLALANQQLKDQADNDV